MPATVLFHMRLRPEVEAKLRERISRRGELVALIVHILETVDLESVRGLEPYAVREHPGTSARIPVKLHKRLKKFSRARDTSMSALVNGAIDWYCRDRPRKNSKSIHASRASQHPRNGRKRS